MFYGVAMIRPDRVANNLGLPKVELWEVAHNEIYVVHKEAAHAQADLCNSKAAPGFSFIAVPVPFVKG